MSASTFSDKDMMIGPQSNKNGVLHHTEPLEIILAPEFPPDYLPTTVALLLHDRSAAVKALLDSLTRISRHFSAGWVGRWMKRSACHFVNNLCTLIKGIHVRFQKVGQDTTLTKYIRTCHVGLLWHMMTWWRGEGAVWIRVGGTSNIRNWTVKTL